MSSRQTTSYCWTKEWELCKTSWYSRVHSWHCYPHCICISYHTCLINSNLSSWMGVECWCDFGANLVQHFMRWYTRYSRYRTKSHDKTTISNDITRYQTVLSKHKEIIIISYIQKLWYAGLFVLYGPSRTSVPTRLVYVGYGRGDPSPTVEEYYIL